MTDAGPRARKRFEFRPPPELRTGTPPRTRLLIVGGGPIGLTAALALGRRGYETLVLNKLDILAEGSKAICVAKHALDIYDRLGVGPRIIDKGVAWEAGKVFWGDLPEPVYEFTMQPVPNQKSPGFVNLQQYYLEEYLLEALAALPNVEVRWRNEVVGIAQAPDCVRVGVATPEGRYTLESEYVIACDGCKSAIRDMLGLDFEGRTFEDNFLIADVRFEQERPAERWFWFNPPFPGDSALLHKQPDRVWRLDFQLGPNIDRAEVVKPEYVRPFVEGMIGADTRYELEWLSVYTFQCRRMARFVHDRIIFAGDAAHLVSPFGARGANSGVADVDNLAWKLDLVLQGAAPASLLESYNEEAAHAADVNIMNSARSTDFITPKSEISRVHRDAVLELARSFAFARPFVNSGRLATAVSYPRSSLNTPDAENWRGGVAPGSPCVDAPLDGGGWLLERLGGAFVLLAFDVDAETRARIEAFTAAAGVKARALFVGEGGVEGALLRERYAATPGATYLVRPDQYVAARRHAFDEDPVRNALARGTGWVEKERLRHAALN